ncbi:MAG: hypothetical protein LBP53_01255 [Candidatus Peribacteria bacterium]|nr:hypothetical protein [Candidatus Peribacteria bacterium]
MPEKKKSLFARIVKNRWKSVIIVLIVFAILRRRSPRKSSSPGIQDFSENRDIIV